MKKAVLELDSSSRVRISSTSQREVDLGGQQAAAPIRRRRHHRDVIRHNVDTESVRNSAERIDKFEQVDQEKVDQKTQVGETESAKSVAGGSGGSQATFVVDCRR